MLLKNGRPEPMHCHSRSLLACLVLLTLCSAARCGFKNIAIDAPVSGELFDEGPVALSARVGSAVVPSTVQVRIDGVDLIAALGLVPPFADVAGTVPVGPDLVTVTSFRFTAPGNPKRIDFQFSGLSAGPHAIEITGGNASTVLISRSVDFTFVDFFVQAAHVVGAAGLPAGVGTTASGDFLVSATLAEPVAFPPLVGGGEELRSGFSTVASALASGGTP